MLLNHHRRIVRYQRVNASIVCSLDPFRIVNRPHDWNEIGLQRCFDDAAGREQPVKQILWAPPFWPRENQGTSGTYAMPGAFGLKKPPSANRKIDSFNKS